MGYDIHQKSAIGGSVELFESEEPQIIAGAPLPT